MNWNWILFGNQTSVKLRLIRLYLILVPLSLLVPGLYYLTLLLGIFHVADWGGLGLLIGLYAWAILVVIVELILLTIYSIVKIPGKDIIVAENYAHEDWLIFNVLIYYVSVVLTMFFLSLLALSSPMLILIVAIVTELILILILSVKHNTKGLGGEENLIKEKRTITLGQRIKVFLKFVLFLLVMFPVTFYIMSLVAKFTG